MMGGVSVRGERSREVSEGRGRHHSLGAGDLICVLRIEDCARRFIGVPHLPFQEALDGTSASS